jgi:hypothetical protein
MQGVKKLSVRQSSKPNNAANPILNTCQSGLGYLIDNQN